MANARRPEGFGKERSYEVAASTHIYHGDGVCLNSSGYAVPASATTGLISVGVAVQEVDNSAGAAGDLRVIVQRGVYGFPAASGDEPTRANIGDAVYFSGAQEIAVTGTGKSVAGIFEYQDPSDDLYYVSLGQWPLPAGLLAASNLSDVGSAATARANIGANRWEATIDVPNLTSGTRAGFVAPRGVTITEMKSVLLGAVLATGDATLQLKIAGVNATNGLITVTQAGSAIGDVDTSDPFALNVATEDQFIEIAVGGTNSEANARATVTLGGTF